MIISKIFDELDEEGIEEFLFVSFLGIIGGFCGGILLGFEIGLSLGIVFGILLGFMLGCLLGNVEGMIRGIVFGISFWISSVFMVILINFSEALPFINGVMSVLFLIVGIIILAEILFWVSPKEKVKKKNLFKHTLKKKAEVLFEVLLSLVLIIQMYVLMRDVDFIKYLPEILKWIGYIGAGMIVAGFIIGLFYLWIKLNSFKYTK